MKKLIQVFGLSIGLLTAGSLHALSQNIACTGQNLMPQMRSQAPKIAAELDAEIASTLYGNGLLWKVSKPGLQPSYLFGTIHLSDPRLLELKPQVKRAFESSNVLALEITEILDPQKLSGMAFSLMKYTTYTDGSDLEGKLNEEERNAVKEAITKKMGLPWSIAKKMKPWALMGALSLPACEMARKRAQKPVVDVNLGLLAKDQGKEIVGLETMESQLSAMDSLPESFSLKGLVQSVSLGQRMDDLFETMIQQYLAEDIASIWAMMRRIGDNGFVHAQENPDYAQFQKTIVDNRNHTMVASAKTLIDKGGAFIAIGALHLPGEQGMVNILAQQGYEVSRVID